MNMLESSVNTSPKNSIDSYESECVIQINFNCDDVDIKNVEGEHNLIDYTNSNLIKNANSSFYIKQKTKSDNMNEFNQYYTMLDASFQVNYIRSNSPVDSCSNSENFTNTLAAMDLETFGYSSDGSYNSEKFKVVKKYKKLSYKDVEKFINRNYYNYSNKYSSEIDILTTYVNGQKNLYIQSKYITQSKLNLLVVPTIIITTTTTILTPFADCEHWGAIIISTLNAIILFLIYITNYLKLESSIENYSQNAKLYDKLETSLEMATNKLLFIEIENDKNILVLKKIQEIEEMINDIKESNNVLIPDEVKKIFPIIYNINIFSFIKKIEVNKRNLINNLTDIKNEIRFILYKWDSLDFSNDTVELSSKAPSLVQNIEQLKEKKRLQFLFQVKDNIKNELLELNNIYSYIDTVFLKEISLADIKKNRWWRYLFFNKIKNKDYKTNNPIIDKYFNTIFSES
jgi:hypothetical protein